MTTVWEVDIECRVRKTLHISGPGSEQTVREVVKASLRPGGLSIHKLQKWIRGEHYLPEPVETMIDNDPQIVAVRAVPE